jgi:O-acetyl-ADP-ribose deacetylase (regulator of RNase III)
MEVGSGMLFPVSVVDGLVHQLGGWSLQAELSLKRFGSKEPCPVGRACRTSAGQGALRDEYDAIVHTTPPFYKYDGEPKEKLRECYKSALHSAFENQDKDWSVAIPLLGAGARGFPVDVAIDIAAGAAVEWCQTEQDESASTCFAQTIAFGLLEDENAQDLSDGIDKGFGK